MFADDAYNKYAKQGAGTLIGNWFEERTIRDATGEGRTVPQRHIPRSGLLKDFTKTPASGPRAQDNTFERVTGPRFYVKPVPMSKTIGAGEADLAGEKPIPDLLQAEGRVDRVGPRELLARAARADAAEKEVQMYEAVLGEKAKQRSFSTTTGSVHRRPDETLIDRPTHYRHCCQRELSAGPPADRSRALLNAGMEVQSNVHYANVEGVTLQKTQMADSRMRSDVKCSATLGVSSFGRSSEFTKPVLECIRGLSKDDELEAMYENLKTTCPNRIPTGARPNAHAFSGLPSLTALKDTIHQRIASRWGRQGYMVLFEHLADRANHEGFVKTKDIVEVLRGPLQLTDYELEEDALQIYLKTLLTMSKDELRITQFMGSLQPLILQRLGGKTEMATVVALASELFADLIEPPLANEQVRVYGIPASQNCCSPIMLAMEVKAGGLEFCNTMSGEHKGASYLAINPAGQVPGVEDADVKGGESNAIMRYIAMKYGSKFYPAGKPAVCFKIDFALDDFVSTVYLPHTDVVYIALGFKPLPSVSQAEANKRYGESIVRWMSRHVLGKFGLGEQLSLIDFKAVPFFFAAMQPVVQQRTGFVLPARAKKYVEDVMQALPLSAKFLTEGDFSVKQFAAKSEGGIPPPTTTEEPSYKPGHAVKVGSPGPMGAVKIHAIPPSQNSCGPVILAMEARVGGMQFCDITAGDHQAPAFMSVNPAAKIPALEDGSVRGGESSAILRYLALAYAPKFYPKSSPADCYKIDFAMDDFSNSVYKAHVDVVYPVMGFKGPTADPSASNREYKARIEKWLKDHVRGPFVLGSAVSIADIKVVPFFYAAMQPAVRSTGFTPPARMEEYVQDIMAHVSAATFLESAGGFSIKEYMATKER